MASRSRERTKPPVIDLFLICTQHEKRRQSLRFSAKHHKEKRMEYSHNRSMRRICVLLALAMLMATLALSVFAEKAAERTRAEETTASAVVTAAADTGTTENAPASE